MRLTAVLFKINHHRKLKRLWKKASQMEIAPLEISPELQQLGIQIHDAKDIVKVQNSYNEEPETDTSLLLPSDYSTIKKFYLFNDRVRITEKEDQVLCLTKSILYPELPKSITSLVGLVQIPNQDELVQQSLIQALVKDPQFAKLPKKVNVKKPGWIYPREYGVRYKRKSANLMEKLSFLCEMGCGKYPDSYSRSKIIQPYSEVVIERGVDTVVCQMLGDILFTSKKPLKAFSSASEVQTTRDIVLPSIYPVKPTLDLEQCEVNPVRHLDDINFLDSTSTSPYHPHTLHIIHKSFGFWFPVQKVARAVVACFTFAAEEARKKYGRDVKELPEPVSIQCIYSDTATIGCMAYQLNTLDLTSDDGIKNQVWVEEMQKMCEEIHEDMIYEVTGISDYDNSIFPKMLAMYLNGAHPDSLQP